MLVHDFRTVCFGSPINDRRSEVNLDVVCEPTNRAWWLAELRRMFDQLEFSLAGLANRSLLTGQVIRSDFLRPLRLASSHNDAVVVQLTGYQLEQAVSELEVIRVSRSVCADFFSEADTLPRCHKQAPRTHGRGSIRSGLLTPRGVAQFRRELSPDQSIGGQIVLFPKR